MSSDSLPDPLKFEEAYERLIDGGKVYGEEQMRAAFLPDPTVSVSPLRQAISAAERSFSGMSIGHDKHPSPYSEGYVKGWGDCLRIFQKAHEARADSAVPSSHADYERDLALTAGPKIEWPKERRVGREGDMGPERLWVTLDSDNDVSLSVNLTDTVEFCNTGGNGGGRSPHTRAALINLMAAIERDAAGPEARADSAVPSSHVSETDETNESSAPVAWRYKYLGTWHLADERPNSDAQCVMPLYAKAENESILREALARLVAILNLGTIPQFNRWWEAIEFDDAMKAARSALAGMNASGDPTERPG